MSEYNDYGYSSLSQSCAHAYLKDMVMKLLSKGKNKTILDVGCGNGWLANFLAKNGFNVYGTDASVSGINLANKSMPNHFYVQDLSNDYLPAELSVISFDTIISTEVIEHLYNPRKYIEFCRKVLLKNKGGELIISTPYHGYLKNLVMALTGTLDNHFTVLWDGGHIKFWSRKTLTKVLEEYGFTVIEFKGVGRLPFLWKSMIIKAKI